MTYPRSRFGDAAQGGYTYVGLLIFVAVFGLISADSLRVGVTAQRRVAEQELLERGLALTRALESYSQATPGGQSSYPQEISDLLRDPRYQKKVVRHLRRIDVDPITGRAEWGVVMTPDKRWIIGFHSLSDQKARRRDFPAPFDDFSDKPFYRDWVFSAGLGE
ncbi:MAG: type II secretion system protein [Polaromonas sp.]|nr:type II secretion system protein [Polaromonas sp.]